jgi:hypothetical protein
MMRNCRLQENVPVPVMKPKLQQIHVGNKASVVIGKVMAMKSREKSAYLYKNYIKAPKSQEHQKYLSLNPEDDVALWREKICHWTYSVIDHFNLSRKTVAISINMFDRYLATLGDRCDGSHALLVSLTTLYIAIKVHEKKKIKLTTLSELSRSQFDCEHIEKMEIKILQSIAWLVHPPIAVDYASLLLKFLAPSVPMPIRHQIFEHTRYMSELSVCDPVFIKFHQSTIAFAAIINVLEQEIGPEHVSLPCRHKFYQCLFEELGFDRQRSVVRFACDRLQTMVAASGAAYGDNKENSQLSPASQSTISTKDIDSCSRSDDNSMSTTFTFDSAEVNMMKSPSSRCSSVDSRNSLGSKGSSTGIIFRSRSGLVVTPCS